MKYPSIKTAAAEKIAHNRLAGMHIDTTNLVQWKTTLDKNEDFVDVDPLLALGETLRLRVEATEPTPPSKDAVEGEFSVQLHAAVDELPIEVLDDPTFWAWVSLECFYDFVAWRENLSSEGGNKYYDGRNSSECVVVRMFHRARLVTPESDLATAIPRGTDFWRSHIIRVRTSTAPELSKALVEAQAQDRMMTNELRELAKRINRLWTNLSLQDYSIEEARALIDQERSELSESQD